MKEEKHIANLIAGFGSFKFLPIPIVFSSNNANPKLILYSDHIEYRGGFVTRTVKYDDIEKVDVYIKGKRTNNIVVYKSTGSGTFLGNFKDRTQLKEFLKIFKEKNCLLTDKAKKELENVSEQ